MFQEKAIQVSMVADSNTGMLNKCITVDHSTMTLQYSSAEYLNLIPSHGDDTVINIQLSYNPNAPMEPDL